MSHRGYGEPPYPPDEPNPRARTASGRERDRRVDTSGDREPGRFDRTSGDPRLPVSDLDDRARAAEPRWTSTTDDRYDAGASRQARSRWSNPPPRRRRGANNGGRSFAPSAPLEPTVIDPPPARGYDDPVADPRDDQEWNDPAPVDTWPAEPVPPLRTRRQPRLSGRVRTGRDRAGARSSTRGSRPALPAFRIPDSIARIDFFRDHVAVLLLSIATLSALAMAGVLAARSGGLADVIELRYDATGAPARWGTPSSLWQLPLLAGMVTLINLVLAVWLSTYDRFAGRFLLATASVVGLLAWIPLVRFLW